MFFVLSHLHVVGIIQVPLTLGLILIPGDILRNLAVAKLGIDFPGWSLPASTSFLFYFLVYTFLDYWAHRAQHCRLLWPLHRYHHSATEFCVLSSDRAHPTSASLTQLFIKSMPMLLIGAPIDAIIDAGMVCAVINYINHSRIDSDWGWFGRYVIQSPRHHRLHHLKEFTTQACNYSVLPIWDYLFRTMVNPAPGTIQIGVETEYRHGLWIVPDLLCDFLEFLHIRLRRPTEAPTTARIELDRIPLARDPLADVLQAPCRLAQADGGLLPEH